MYICIQGMRDCCETDPIPHSRVHMHKSLAEDLTKIWEPQMLDLYFHELITRKVPTHTFNEHTHTRISVCQGHDCPQHVGMLIKHYTTRPNCFDHTPLSRIVFPAATNQHFILAANTAPPTTHSLDYPG